MSLYYLDTSALVKRYIDETGSQWLRAIIDTAEALLSTQLPVPEVISALNCLVREELLAPPDYHRLRLAFQQDCIEEYQLTPLNSDILSLSCKLIERHPLRAYDAVHLATALVAERALEAQDLPHLTFLSADGRLLTVAAAEGLATDDPNQHT